MIIDSLIDKKDTIDVSALAFPDQAKRKKLEFDPKVDLTATDLDLAVYQLSQIRSRAHSLPASVSEWANFARPLIFLFPEERDRLGIDEEMRLKIFARMEKLRLGGENPDGRAFLWLAADAKALYPNEINKLDLGEDVFRFVMDELASLNDRPGSKDLLDAVILFPNKRGELLSLDPGIPDSLVSNFSFYRRSNMWQSVASEGSDLKLLWPERLPELSPADWVILRREFGEEKQRSVKFIDTLCHFALSLLVLAANEARIGEEGLVINLRKKDSLETVEKIPDMPVKRKF